MLVVGFHTHTQQVFFNLPSGPCVCVCVLVIFCRVIVTVLSFSNGVAAKEGGGDDLYASANINSEQYFIKCPQCQKGCQTFQGLKEHLETVHAAMMDQANNGGTMTPVSSVASASSPSPSVAVGAYTCTQCTTSFAAKEQLEKHELLHSPNAQVVSENFTKFGSQKMIFSKIHNFSPLPFQFHSIKQHLKTAATVPFQTNTRPHL